MVAFAIGCLVGVATVLGWQWLDRAWAAELDRIEQQIREDEAQEYREWGP